MKNPELVVVPVHQLEQVLALIDDMARFVGQMALNDYAAFNEAPINLKRMIRQPRAVYGEETSPEIATLAARGLQSGKLTEAETRSVCASVLTQAPDRAS